MVITNRKTFLFVVVSLVGLYAVIGQFIENYTYRYDSMCSNLPNETAYWSANAKQTRDSYKLLVKCKNETKNYFKFTLLRNATSAEKNGCFAKCVAIADGLTGQNGTLNKEAIRQRIKVFYSFSNATASYVEQISETLTSCVGNAETFLQELNRSTATEHVGECKIYNLYDKCIMDNSWNLRNDTLQAKYCPEKMKIKIQ